ncbi:histidine phosphatase family protein [Actinocrispum wychmicini]|uniref:Histidine phosphatase superfamily protein (Branch 1) n=1 Tax=Actinocrispum wychmicini TaxID=1213861 RepID=A0A4R2IR30_9PSEU|nr:histidine phosphatase family protein [Actinocrispum wychmicini]TCO46549.1 histidine phosphatase superfamily protein (branch 1) [Actinocrispum wychmicini]
MSHAPTTATRSSAFPDDEPLERTDSVEPVDLGRWGRYLRGPELRCAQTAAGLGWDPTETVVEPALADLDFGQWRGLPLAEVPESDAVRWLNNPEAAPHGGESVHDLLKRVDGWLAGLRDSGERVAVVTHPAVIRAAVVTVLSAPARSFWRIDVAPLSYTRLTCGGGQWTLRETGHPVIY